jgi:Zn-dependent protease with chaperone function
LVVTAFVATIIWFLLIFSGLGIIYVALLALVLWMIHLALIGHLRGSAVRLGPNQFPELYASIDTLAQRMGMRTPEAYLMQAGGSLNAFATRFLFSNIVVLFSDLLEACGDNTSARDMIIAHELGHIKCGHLRWHWFLMPAAFIPFLGSALSRAREYTCDLYGLAGAGDAEGASFGLTILASGGILAPKVNRAELVRQRETILRSGLMTLAEWFGSHPPLSKRIAEIDPMLAGTARVRGGGPVVAATLVVGVPALLFMALLQIAQSSIGANFLASINPNAATSAQDELDSYVVPADAELRARAEVAQLAEFIEQERKRGSIPWNLTEVRQRMAAAGYRGEFPVDPYDGSDYGYDQRGGDFMVWSSGADQLSWTEDDIRYDSRIGGIVGASAGTRRQ